jgi:hypothetical protein
MGIRGGIFERGGITNTELWRGAGWETKWLGAEFRDLKEYGS